MRFERLDSSLGFVASMHAGGYELKLYFQLTKGCFYKLWDCIVQNVVFWFESSSGKSLDGEDYHCVEFL